ncbi:MULTISPECIES: ACP S-malonyltransferase [unclassified Streptomyces]|uniref:ACP S-malonyltransferase n=1 Tax=unclassified Streptomyces TaxID=2593676 RepID=UPI000CD5707B|nr:ACP S-malonyltransferase [Streptomyces sp. SM10]
MFGIIAPGQGSQTPGMLAGWLRDPECAASVRQWSEASGCDLAHLGTKASSAEIARTENTQPLLVAQGLLAHGALAGKLTDGAAVVAGHSVGELTAAVYAGVLDPADAVRLAAVRGRAMAEACAGTPTSMAAVVGGDEAEVLAHLSGLGLSPATYNGPGQIVAAGTSLRIGQLIAHPPRGATVKELQVAGAFHTPHMESARQVFADAAAATHFARPRLLLLSNADGAVVTSPDGIRHRLVEQVVRPVRWDLCMDALDRTAPGAVISLPPARTLTGILKRRYPGIDVVALNTPRDIAKAAARLDAGAGRTEPARAGV